MVQQKWTCDLASVSSERKCELVEHHFRPDPKFDFPSPRGECRQE